MWLGPIQGLHFYCKFNHKDMIQKQMTLQKWTYWKQKRNEHNEQWTQEWEGGGLSRFERVKMDFYSVIPPENIRKPENPSLLETPGQLLSISIRCIFLNIYINVYPSVILQFLSWPQVYWLVMRKKMSPISICECVLFLITISATLFHIAQVTFWCQNLG